MPALRHRPATERETPSSASDTARGSRRSRGRRRADRTRSATDPSLTGWGAGLEGSTEDTGLSAEQTVTLAAVREGAVLDTMSEGPAVQWVQAALTRLGFPVAQTGINGSMTVGLIAEFQRLNQVQANGKVGPTTLAALERAVDASVSLGELKGVAPGLPDGQLRSMLPHLNASMLRAGITTEARKAAYLAQLGHESDGFRTLEEYASGANYEWRADLGNVFAGDGRRFKGRGPIQITGRDNYRRYGSRVGEDLIANPERAATNEVGFKLAAEYWKEHDLNALADAGRFGDITRRINGGTRGWEDRNRRHGQARAVLAANRDKPKVAVRSQTAEVRGSLGDPRSALAGVQTRLAEARAALAAGDPAAAKDHAHAAAEAARKARSEGTLSAEQAEPWIATAGQVWTRAEQGSPPENGGAPNATALDPARGRLDAAELALQAGDWRAAKAEAHTAANTVRARIERGELPADQGTPLVEEAGALWSRADRMSKGFGEPGTSTAASAAAVSGVQGLLDAAWAALEREDYAASKSKAHAAAEAARRSRDDGSATAEEVEPLIGVAGQIWSRASQQEEEVRAANQSRGTTHAVWTTGRPGGRGAVTSRQLADGGRWSPSQFLAHHADRSSSWAARNLRNSRNQDLQAYDFTFERTNRSGAAIAGTAQGLPLLTPWDARVHDIQHTFQGSGGYGKFIALEDLETGLRFQVNHLDTVGNFSKGQILDGGTVIGTQGASGSRRYQYATHVDIVGTQAAVEQFVRANQTGEFRRRPRDGGA